MQLTFKSGFLLNRCKAKLIRETASFTLKLPNVGLALYFDLDNIPDRTFRTDAPFGFIEFFFGQFIIHGWFFLFKSAAAGLAVSQKGFSFFIILNGSEGNSAGYIAFRPYHCIRVY